GGARRRADGGHGRDEREQRRVQHRVLLQRRRPRYKGRMEVVILPSPEAVGAHGARLVADLLARKPGAVFGLPTGARPRPLYAGLVRMHRQEGLSFARATTFNLDEYVGLPGDHPASFRRYIREALAAHVDLRPERVHCPDGMAADLAAA